MKIKRILICHCKHVKCRNCTQHSCCNCGNWFVAANVHRYTDNLELLDLIGKS